MKLSALLAPTSRSHCHAALAVWAAGLLAGCASDAGREADQASGGTGGTGAGMTGGTGAGMTGGTGAGMTGGTGAGATGGVATGGVSTGGVGATGGVSTGGVGATGGVSTGGVGATGAVSTGGVGATGGAGAGGTGGATTCTNVRPTGTDWDEATCDDWASQTSECTADWMIDNGYCDESCGRCGGTGTGGTSTGGTSGSGGVPTGGTSGSGGEPTGGTSGSGGEPTGGTSGSGGSGGGVTYDCGLPPAGDGGVPKPSGSTANLQVLDWAGFNSAVSYSFDDSNSSQISHYDEMNALGGKYTFYLQTNKPESSDPVWARALEDGHELGNHTSTHNCDAGAISSAQTFIQNTFGVTAYTLAAPNGTQTCSTLGASQFLLIRSVNGGTIGPRDNTDPDWIPSNIPGGLGVTAGRWQVYCIHGFTGGTDGAYQPIAFDSFTSAVTQALASGSWVDSVIKIGAYWIAQKAFPTSGTDSWSWTLPSGFPPGQCLRVTVDGGTLSQDEGPLAWDEHGYYEVSLDAGSLSWTP